jgi:hypothetical protein
MFDRVTFERACFRLLDAHNGTPTSTGSTRLVRDEAKRHASPPGASLPARFWPDDVPVGRDVVDARFARLLHHL